MDAYLQKAREAIDEAVGGLAADAIARKTAEQWSIAEILEHLTLAFSGHVAALERALASGQLRARRPTLQQRLIRVLVSDLNYFPRVKAPKTTQPSGRIQPAQVLAATREALEALDATLSRVSAKFGDDVPVSNHPYFGGMSVRQWRKFHWRHTVHHMKQARSRALLATPHSR